MEEFSYVAIALVITIFAMYWVIRFAVTHALEDVDRKRRQRDQQAAQPPYVPH